MTFNRDHGSCLDRVILLVAMVLGIYGWLVFAAEFRWDGLIGPRYNAPGVDYVVHWSAARAAMRGDFALLADPARFTDDMNAEFQNWLRTPLPQVPWMYPPIYLLLLAPFASLPFVPSYLVFQLTSFAAAAWAGWKFWSGSARWSLWIVGLGLAPATSVNAVTGQNALLTLALLLVGVGLLGKRSILGGVVLGLVSYKPQFALLVPVALLAARDWRALAGAAMSIACVAMISWAVFGFVPWHDWLTRTIWSDLVDSPESNGWSAAGRLWGFSIWACATVLGAPGWLANLAQFSAIVFAAGCVWVVFSRDYRRDRRMAVLLAATLIAAPHSFTYDLAMLAGATLLIYQDVEIASIGRPTLLLLPWASPLTLGPRSSPIGFGVPLITLWVLCMLVGNPFKIARAIPASRNEDALSPHRTTPKTMRDGRGR